jgi:hypothetical protein
MFKLQKTNAVWWPVTINVPADGGTVTEHKIQVKFELIPQDEFDSLAQQGDINLLQRFVKDWQDISNENDEPLPFNDENSALLFKVPYLRSAFIYGYMNAVSGAPSKN